MRVRGGGLVVRVEGSRRIAAGMLVLLCVCVCVGVWEEEEGVGDE